MTLLSSITTSGYVKNSLQCACYWRAVCVSGAAAERNRLAFYRQCAFRLKTCQRKCGEPDYCSMALRNNCLCFFVQASTAMQIRQIICIKIFQLIEHSGRSMYACSRFGLLRVTFSCGHCWIYKTFKNCINLRELSFYDFSFHCNYFVESKSQI